MMTLPKRLFRRRPTQKTALIAWEIGAGFTHALNIWGVVRHLRNMGVECIVAAADLRNEAWFRALGAHVVQTFLWPAMRAESALPDQRPARMLTDIFANYAISRSADLAAAIAHYDALFHLAKPDVILCENAFGALLAARGGIPSIVFGSTLLFMPPIIGGAFAPIDAAKPAPSWPVAEVLDGVNAGLGASARPPLSQASEILACDAMIPFGPAAFDPYGSFRAEGEVRAPFCPGLPRTFSSAPGRDTIVYLHSAAQDSETLMEGLAALDPPARIYIPSLSSKLAERFIACGHKVEENMLPLSLIAAHARVLVHQGGVSLTSAALALGVPQIILARFYENGLAGSFVARGGLGATRGLDKADADWLASSVARMRDDTDTLARAQARRGEFGGWFDEDPTGVVARKAASLLGIPFSPAPPPGDGPS